MSAAIASLVRHTGATLARRASRRLAALAMACAFGAGACGPIDELREQLDAPGSAHEAYARALESSGLAYTALGQDWLRAAEQALREPFSAELPLREEGYFAADRPAAVAYSVSMARGQRVAVHASLRPDASGRLFIDVFSAGDSLEPPRRVASADSLSAALEFEPRRAGRYIIRIQPELLRGGRYTLSARAGPSLSFPVSGAGRRNVQSVFGAPRDGGARRHHGIDIFVPRGTPVLAAAAGRISRVQETPIGGRVVWLRDERRGYSLYYAHLDSQLVSSGLRVRPGDTLGTVGSTGNARGTAPHLHFGIYARGEGPVDPLPFLHVSDTTPPVPAGDLDRLGQLLRTRSAATARIAPAPDAPALADLPAGTLLRAAGAIAQWYRLELPDGRNGFLPAAVLIAADEPLWRRPIPDGLELRDAPRANAALIARLDAAAGEIAVHGTWGRFAFVSLDTLRGWVPAASGS